MASRQFVLVPVAIGAWAAAASTTLLAPLTSVRIAVGAVLVATAMRRRLPIVAAIALGVGFGAGSAAQHVHALRGGPLPSLARDHAEVEVIARLVRDPVVTTSASGIGLTLTDATVTSVWSRGGWQHVNSPVLVLSYGSGWRALLPGQRVDVTGRLGPPRSGDDVAAVLSARAPPTPQGRAPWWERLAGRARSRLRIASARLPADERGLLPSLVDGDDAAVPPSLQRDLRVTGLSHLEAVSGENVTVVIVVTLALARAVGLRRRGRAALCALALVGFVVLARPSPSVLRAAVMGAIALLALVVGRRSAALPSLGTAVIALVVVDPFLARTVGFVLSVAATGGIVLLAPNWTERLARWVPRPLAVAIAVPAAAQFACTPVLILAFGQLAPYSVPANLLAAPAVVPATILGVLAAIIATIWLPAATPLAMVGAAPAGVIAVVARELAAMPGADLRWSISVGLGLLGLGALILLARFGAWSARHDILDAWRP